VKSKVFLKRIHSLILRITAILNGMVLKLGTKKPEA
jgi:hypothetical protein